MGDRSPMRILAVGCQMGMPDEKSDITWMRQPGSCPRHSIYKSVWQRSAAHITWYLGLNMSKNLLAGRQGSLDDPDVSKQVKRHAKVVHRLRG